MAMRMGLPPKTQSQDSPTSLYRMIQNDPKVIQILFPANPATNPPIDLGPLGLGRSKNNNYIVHFKHTLRNSVKNIQEHISGAPKDLGVFVFRDVRQPDFTRS